MSAAVGTSPQLALEPLPALEPSATEATPSLARRAWRTLHAYATDSMVHKAGFSLADQAIVSATNFATSVILGKRCDNEALGAYYLALSVVFFVRGLQEQLVASPFMVRANKMPAERLPTFSGSVLAHQMALMATTAIVIAIAAATGGWSLALSDALWVLVGAAPLMLAREFVRQFSFARMHMARALALDSAVGVLQVGALATVAWCDALDVTTAFLIIAAATALPTIGWAYAGRGTFVADARQIGRDFLENWTLGRWALASTLLACAATYAMPWVLKFVQGDGAAGVLGASTTLVGLANMFVLGLSNFMCPRSARAYATGGVKSLRDVLLKAAALYAVVLGCFVALMAFAGDALMQAVYRDGLEGAGRVAFILAIGQLVNSLGIAAGNGLWAIERPSANFAADAVNFCVTVVLSVAFGYLGLLGPVGAAVVTVCGLSAGTATRIGTLAASLKELAGREHEARSCPQGACSC